MPQRNVLVLEKKESPWIDFLGQFFDDTPSKMTLCADSASAGAALERTPHDIALINTELLSLALAQKLKVFRQSSPDFRIFKISAETKSPLDIPCDSAFDSLPTLISFQKQLVQNLPLPETIHVLVIDDEAEIGAMVQDFLSHRVSPSFEVDYVENGKKGLEAIENKRPDVVVMDIKMPVMDGRQAYREMAAREFKIPVIVFFDAISGDEMVEIHKVGRPAVVDKGSRQSAMPEMMALIKKMAYFG